MSQWGPRPSEPTGEWKPSTSARIAQFINSPSSALPPQISKLTRLLLFLAFFESLSEWLGAFGWINAGIRAVCLLLIASIWLDSRAKSRLDRPAIRVVDVLVYAELVVPAVSLFFVTIYSISPWPARVSMAFVESNAIYVVLFLIAVESLALRLTTIERGDRWRLGLLLSILGLAFAGKQLRDHDLRLRWRLPERIAKGSLDSETVLGSIVRDIDNIQSLMQPWFSALGLAICLATGLAAYIAVMSARGYIHVNKPHAARMASALEARRQAHLGQDQPSKRLLGLTQQVLSRKSLFRTSRADHSSPNGDDRYFPGVPVGFLGREERYASPESTVLILGPPRSGKTSAIVIPAVESCAGPVVSTSTKLDVLEATSNERARRGAEVWQFDPLGRTESSGNAALVHWNPADSVKEWDDAVRIARLLMKTSLPVNYAKDSGSHHFEHLARSLLASCLYGAALFTKEGESRMRYVCKWVHDHALPGEVMDLFEAKEATLALSTFASIENIPSREQGSVYSSASVALSAYQLESAMRLTENSNFSIKKFVQSENDSLYITCSSEDQDLAAPLIVALLEEMRACVFLEHRRRAGASPGKFVYWILDEIANIAPLPDLPSLVSEAGGQGLHLVAALQDLSQARQRWGPEANGLLTLFTHKLVLPGVVDYETLRALESLSGQWDQPIATVQRSGPELGYSTSWSSERRPLLSIGDLARIPRGHAVSFTHDGWELLELVPNHLRSPRSAPIGGGPAPSREHE